MKTRFIRSRLVKSPIVAITLFGHVFYRNTLTRRVMNHEMIHVRQQKELLYLPFFIWYVLEWLIRLVQYQNRDKAYRNISFEREAYSNEQDISYPSARRPFSFLRYLTSSGRSS